jgi:hypothetical protein
LQGRLSNLSGTRFSDVQSSTVQTYSPARGMDIRRISLIEGHGISMSTDVACVISLSVKDIDQFARGRHCDALIGASQATAASMTRILHQTVRLSIFRFIPKIDLTH